MIKKSLTGRKSKRNLPKKEKWKFRFSWPQMDEMRDYWMKMENKVRQKSSHGGGGGAFSAGWAFPTRAKAISAFNKIKSLRLKHLKLEYGVQKEDTKNRLF